MSENARTEIFIGRKDKTTFNKVQYVFITTSTSMATPHDLLYGQKQKPTHHCSIPFVHDNILGEHPRIRNNQHLHGKIIYSRQHKVYSIRAHDISIRRPIKIII